MKRTFRTIPCVALVIVGLAFDHSVTLAQDTDVCSETLTAAQDAFNTGRFQEAVNLSLTCLQQATPTDAQRQELLLLQSRSVFFMGQRGDAEEMLRSLLSTYPTVTLNAENEIPAFLNMFNEIRSEISAELAAAAAAAAASGNSGGPVATDSGATTPIVSNVVMDATEVDEIPLPVGGRADIQRNLVYPEQAQQNGTEGYVHVRFVVDTQGMVQDAEVWRGIGDGCDEAALQAIQRTRYIPGKHNGEIVSVKMSMSLPFFLQ